MLWTYIRYFTLLTVYVADVLPNLQDLDFCLKDCRGLITDLPVEKGARAHECGQRALCSPAFLI